MLTNRQKALLKRAQREAGIEDPEYRDALHMIAQVRTSTAPELTDRHLDKLMALFEAECWYHRDAGALPPPGPNSVFRARGFWAQRNTAASTTRDRFIAARMTNDIASLKARLAAMGYGDHYCQAITAKCRTPAAQRRALERTLAYKQRAATPCPSVPVRERPPITQSP